MEYKNNVNPVRETSKSFPPKPVKSNWMIRERVKPPARTVKFIAVFTRENEFVCQAVSKEAARELCRKQGYWYEEFVFQENDLQREERKHRATRTWLNTGTHRELTKEGEFEHIYNYRS